VAPQGRRINRHINDAAEHVMNQNAKVGLFVLGIVALGIFLADQSAITPHKQFDPMFIMIMLVIGAIIWFAGSRN
jgi:hypothetical protein